MVVLVTCSNGHHFPVNPKKHRDRNYRLCPHVGCREKVIIKRRFSFMPNPDWAAMRQGYADAAEQKRAQRARLELINEMLGLKRR